MAVSLAFTDHGSVQATNGTSTATIAGLSIGAAASDRIVVIGLGFIDVSTSIQADPSSVTIGGITATKAIVGNLNAAWAPAAYVYWAPVPTGTTASLVVNFPTNAGTSDYLTASIYRVIGSDTTTPVIATASTATHTSTQAVSGSITVPTNGALIAIGAGVDPGNALSVTWVNATGDFAFDGVLTTDLNAVASRTTAATSAITVNNSAGTSVLMEIAVAAFQVPTGVAANILFGSQLRW